MDKFDEMDTEISKKADLYAYSVILLFLVAGMVYELVILFINPVQYNPWPLIISTTALSTRFLSGIYLKRKMSKDDEFNEPMSSNDKGVIVFCVFWLLVNASEILKIVSRYF